MTTTYIAGLFGILGVLTGSLITHVLNKSRNMLEMEKLRTEIIKIRLEIRRTEIELKHIKAQQSELLADEVWESIEQN